MQQGLMCYPMGGTIDGRQGDHLLLAPPFIVSDAELEEIIRGAVWRKELKHHVNEPGFRPPPRTMSAIGG